MEICRVEYSILFLLMLCTIWSICLDLELFKMKDNAIQGSCPLYSPLTQGQGCFLSQLLLAPIALARCKKILKTKENPDWVLKDTFSMSYNQMATDKIKSQSQEVQTTWSFLLRRCGHSHLAAKVPVCTMSSLEHVPGQRYGHIRGHQPLVRALVAIAQLLNYFSILFYSHFFLHSNELPLCHRVFLFLS